MISRRYRTLISVFLVAQNDISGQANIPIKASLIARSRSCIDRLAARKNALTLLLEKPGGPI